MVLEDPTSQSKTQRNATLAAGISDRPEKILRAGILDGEEGAEEGTREHAEEGVALLENWLGNSHRLENLAAVSLNLASGW